eukprot:PITA_33792
MDSIRLALSIAAARGWEVHHMDVKNAFLFGDLEEEIYMEQPSGYMQNSSLGTITYGIHYAANCSLNLIGFTDSDWAGDTIDRKSTSGYVLSLGSGPIFWSSEKQAAIALSSAEAEYRGAVNATIQEIWLQHFLSELGISVHHPTVISCDNQSTLKFCRDPVQWQRTKHIEIHMHFIRELIHDGVIDLQYCPSSEQIANIFTKTFTEQKFRFLRDRLGAKDTTA